MLYDNLIPPIGGDDKKFYNFPIQDYAPFGQFADTFKKMGWMPVVKGADTNEYHPQYGLLSSVELNDGKGTKGYFSIKAGKTNGIFDVNIKNPSGKIVKPILQGVTAQDVNNYFTNTGTQEAPLGSVINQRHNSIVQGTYSQVL